MKREGGTQVTWRSGCRITDRACVHLVKYRSNQVKKENQATYEKGRIRIHGRK